MNEFDEPSDGTADGEDVEGTFLVTDADEHTAVLKDVDGGRVHTLADNPGVEARDVVAGTLAAVPPMAVTWRIVSVDDRRSLAVELSDEPPTAHEREAAAEQAVGELTRIERAGTGELHVITVDPGETAEAARDVVEDEGTLARAARMDGVDRVEVRAEDGVVSVRYLP